MRHGSRMHLSTFLQNLISVQRWRYGGLWLPCLILTATLALSWSSFHIVFVSRACSSVLLAFWLEIPNYDLISITYSKFTESLFAWWAEEYVLPIMYNSEYFVEWEWLPISSSQNSSCTWRHQASANNPGWYCDTFYSSILCRYPNWKYWFQSL